MSGKSKTKDKVFLHLDTFIRQNEKIDFKTASPSEISANSQVDWKRLNSYKDEILNQLKPYQRLLKIMPEGTTHDIIISLLEEGIHSAAQIASIPSHLFISQYLPLFGNDKDYIENFYKNCQAIRSRLLVQFMNKLQNNELHINSTKL
ncbi:MAG: hypothetical protein R3B93_21595 [Bacteroidia bacterium]